MVGLFNRLCLPHPVSQYPIFCIIVSVSVVHVDSGDGSAFVSLYCRHRGRNAGIPVISGTGNIRSAASPEATLCREFIPNGVWIAYFMWKSSAVFEKGVCLWRFLNSEKKGKPFPTISMNHSVSGSLFNPFIAVGHPDLSVHRSITAARLVCPV